MKLARHIELHDAREGNEAVEHGTPVTTSQSEPGGGLANTREGQMELLPCPFCGKTPILSSRPGINHCGRDWSIQCATPGCFNFVTTSSRYRSELIATWNKRPPSLPAVPDVKEEEKTLEEPGDVAANTVQGPMERDVVVKELVAACNDALGYFEAILEISAFIGERGAVESKINRLKTAIANARNASSVPTGSGFPKSGSSSPATVREQMEPRVHRVAIQLCELCLEGKPGECHTPGCALFLHDSPGHPILPELYEILVPSGIVEQPKKETDLGEPRDTITKQPHKDR